MVAIAAVCTACNGDARRAESSGPLIVKIGMFQSRAAAAMEMAGLFSSEPLVAAAWDGRPVYKLAESVEESPNDQRQLIVTLRKNVRFHTGEMITAPVVRDLLRPKLLNYAPEVAAIEALDDRRLLFRLHKRSTVKPEDLSTLIVDSGQDEHLGLRTGPFRITSTNPVVLEPFSGYYQPATAVQRLEIRQYQTQRAAWTGMMRREVNFLHEVNRDAIEFIEAGGDIRSYPLLRPYYTALVFNMRHPVLRRPEVRVAINEAIDRDELVKNGMRNHGRIAEGPFWPYHWAYPHGRFPVSFNQEAAKLRLDGAGLRVAPGAAGQMPARFSFACMVVSGDDRFERIALLVQRQLYAVGIDMRIVPVSGRDLQPRLVSGDFDAYILETGSGRILKWAHRWWHSPSPGSVFARTGYVAADAALDRLQVAHGDDEVREAVSDVMHVMRNDPPAAFLVWPREARAADASLNIPYEPDHDIFGTLWQITKAAPALEARR